MRFQLQTQPASGHGRYATFEDAKAGADEHPDDWQEITDSETAERWVRTEGGDWFKASALRASDATDPNVAAASIVNQIANRR